MWSVQALYMMLGSSLTLVGLVSLVIPFFPTTTAFLASSFFLSRSLPSLQNRIKALPLIGKFIKYLDGTRIMTTRAQLGICAYLWVNLFVTCACLYGLGLASYPIVSINIFCCVLSMLFIFKFHAEQAKVTKTTPEGHANTAISGSEENKLLVSVQGISKELEVTVGGLPFWQAPADNRFAATD
jgi:uncharacterized membrane protein YbaN (DUF454 family)